MRVNDLHSYSIIISIVKYKNILLNITMHYRIIAKTYMIKVLYALPCVCNAFQHKSLLLLVHFLKCHIMAYFPILIFYLLCAGAFATHVGIIFLNHHIFKSSNLKAGARFYLISVIPPIFKFSNYFIFKLKCLSCSRKFD
jgi:hypothetical protein